MQKTSSSLVSRAAFRGGFVACSALAIVMTCFGYAANGQDKPADANVPSTATESRTAPTATDPDEVAIRKSADAFVAAFDRRDAKAIAELWTQDGLYVDEAGQIYAGRQSIAEEYEKFFADHKGAKIAISISAIRKITPTLACEIGAASVVSPSGAKTSASQYMAVHVKQGDGSWLVASVRDSPAVAGSTKSNLQLLDILAGEWTASHAGAEATVTCDWNPRKSFLDRRFVVTKDGREVSSSTELIGWDPLTNQIVSWTFTSGGGRSVGIWTPLEDGWIVQNSGVAEDGASTFSVDAWAPLLDGALGWKSTQRFVGGLPLRDSRHVVLTKKAPGAVGAE